MADRPNLLHIFSDEMRAMDMSCAGSPNIETPNMDRLANEGAMFERMLTASPLCCPARAAMMTGRLPHCAGVTTNNQQLSSDIPCIAELTRDAGYTTGHIGKWHLDGSGGKEDGYDLVPKERHRGFDYWAGFEHGHRYWTNRYFLNDDSEQTFPEGTYETDGQTDLAIDFIHQNHDKPWHLDLSWGPPHFPFDQEKEEDRNQFSDRPLTLRPNVPEEFQEIAEKEYRSYLAMIQNLDWNLGRLLSLLGELDITQNTIVVYTSDHGDLVRSHGQQFKRRPQEESIRVPFLIRYPKAITPGQRISTTASLVDAVPTFLDLMNIDRPKTDGTSWAAQLTGSKDTSNTPETVYIQCAKLGCRKTDPGPYSDHPWRAVCNDQYKAVFLKQEDGSIELTQFFDTQQDPYEMTNLANTLEHQNARQQMTTHFQNWAKNTNDSFVEVT